MPEYLAPGVYVEEIDTGSKPIEGVSTSTAGMIGVTERRPGQRADPPDQSRRLHPLVRRAALLHRLSRPSLHASCGRRLLHQWRQKSLSDAHSDTAGAAAAAGELFDRGSLRRADTSSAFRGELQRYARAGPLCLRARHLGPQYRRLDPHRRRQPLRVSPCRRRSARHHQ